MCTDSFLYVIFQDTMFFFTGDSLSNTFFFLFLKKKKLVGIDNFS